MNNINNIINNINNQKQKQFSFDFYNYLKSCQSKPIKVYIMIIIGLIFLTVGEISFFSNFNKMTIVKCSLPQNRNNGTTEINYKKIGMSLDNCFYEGFKLTTCINNEFATGSNYSLTFSVTKFGLPNDNKNKIMISIALIIFLSFQSIYQPMQYFQYLKRKRIQDILAGSQIFINGKKRNEKILTCYFLIMGIIYIILKVIWFIYRYNQYSELKCGGDGENDNFYLLEFSYTILSSIGTLLGSTIVYLLFPFIFAFGWLDYTSDLNFKKMTDHLSIDSIKEIKNITVLDFKKYNKIIESTLINRYQHESKFNLFKRIHTFSFNKTTNFEIIEILLNYKLTNPQDFRSLLKNQGGEDYHHHQHQYIPNNDNNIKSNNNNNYFRLN